MNKYLATLALFLSILNLLQAQDGYIKYKTDVLYPNLAMKCFKGEIAPFIKTTKANKINVIIGGDTITDLTIPSNNFYILENLNTYNLSLKENLVQLKKNGKVYINTASISQTDTISLISEKGIRLTQLLTPVEALINQLDCGKKFRLIITNTPSIYYITENLKQFVEPEQPTSNSLTVLQKEQEKGLVWLYYSLVGLGIVAIAVCVWLYLRARKLNPNEVRFKGNSLSDFVDSYGGIDELNALNPSLIPTKNDWTKIKYNEQEKKSIIDNLKGKKILIRRENKSSVQPFDQEQTGDIFQQLQKLENRLIREIQIAGSKGNENLSEINRLNNEIINLNDEINKYKNEKQNFESIITQLENNKASLDKQIGQVTIEKKQKVSELNQLQEKIISVDYLTVYSDSVFNFLKLSNQISTDAFDKFSHFSQQNTFETFVLGHLLIKFQDCINSIPLGNWMQILQDIKETGATSNKQLIRSFSQINSEEERKREFQRLLFSEVLIKYSSSILILAEAFRNLGHFQVSTELVNNTNTSFTKHVLELNSKIRPTGLEIKYVPLFKNFEEFLGLVESVDSERSSAYKEVPGLAKGTIAEIVSYGVKTSFEETKTLIILA